MADGATTSPSPGSLGEFVHLHLHTEYSLLDGGNRIDKLVARVAELGMKAVGITDHGNIFGAVAFYAACKEKGIKPILGVEAYVTPPGKPRQDRTYSGGGEGGYHLVLLAENDAGWRNLLYLCSEAYLTGFYYKPRIDREILEKHSEGLIAINGHLGSEIGEHLLAYRRSADKKHWDAAVESAAWGKRVFASPAPATQRHGDTAIHGPRFFVELQHHVPEQNAINPLLIKLARELELPLVCDNDSHFLRAEDHDSHDTLICISTGKGKADENRMRYPPELYVKSPAEMQEVFAEYGADGVEALANTVAIAERCNVTLPIGVSHAPMVRVRLRERGTKETRKGGAKKRAGGETELPQGWAETDLPRHDDAEFGGDLTAWYGGYCSCFEVVPFSMPEGAGEKERAGLLAEAKRECDAALRMLAEAGLVWRYGPSEVGSGKSEGGSEAGERRTRLDRELKILCDKNIAAYFLIVWDFVSWGRVHSVPALARGSGVGTMVGYVLGLSNACPVRYGLLFERFTDPDRSEYPDIDIDLCQDGRGEVISYVRNKYGHVAQIITFGTLKARAAVRDVGRVLEMPLSEVDRIAKLIPEQLGMTLEDALVAEPDLKKMYDRDPKVKQLIDNAMGIEGQARHASVHAAGVIVATRPLHEIVPLYKQTGSADNEVVTQWDGPTCEKMGLLKMDFLGLRTISIVARAQKLIRETLREGEIWEAVGRAGEFEASQRTSEPASQRKKSAPDVVHGLLAHPLDLDRLSFEDQKVFELFRRGETTGIFQFESGGMRRLLVEMKPDRLEDLIAANALFRPGPMDLIPDYNRRKHGLEDVPRAHPIVQQYTAETYGVMVYQEQVMQIVHGLGGIKLRDAYSLIKNISKKKHDKIEKERPKFIEGAQKQGLSKNEADDLFGLILKFAGYGFNKCVVGDTVVTDARTGEQTTVENLFQRRRTFSVHAVTPTGKLAARNVTDVVWNGRKRVVQLRTRQGKTITATGNHPFLTFEGWKNLADLRVGDRIGAPRHLATPTEESWPEHEIIVLAGLLSEGNTCHPTCLYFFGNERRLVNDFAGAANKFEDSVARTYARADERRLEVCVSTGRDMRFQRGQRPWNAPESEGSVAVAERTAVRSGACLWAEGLGIVGVKATSKRVPPPVFQLRDEDIELFMGRLWAGDGYLAGKSSSTPFYATSSQGLARDVQHLLLRLGIISGIHTKSFRYRGTLRPGYTVHLLGEDSVSTFLRRVAPHCIGREVQVGALRERVAAAAPGLTSKDTVPASVRAWVDEERRKAGLTWRELESQSGVCCRELCRVSPGVKKGFRRSKLARLARFFSSARLGQAANSDVFWDEVASIEPKGVQDTYDLTVDTDHNFVADGLIVHNSHSTGYAIVAYQTAYLKTYFPNQYMAAFLTFESGANKVSDWIPYLEDCRRTRFINAATGEQVKVGVEVRPPDINLSLSDFAVVFDEAEKPGSPIRATQGHVRFGLKALKGAGDKSIEGVIVERGKGGAFTSLFEFCERMPAGSVNKSTLEALIKCGAFDSVHGRENRAAMVASIEQALGAGQKAAADKAAGQAALFGGGGKAVKAPPVVLARATPWNEAETLTNEKAALGFYVSSHPLDRWKSWYGVFTTTTTAGIKEMTQDQRAVIAAMVQSVRTIIVRNGKSAGQKMAILTVEDTSGACECALFTDAYSKFGHLAEAEKVVFVLGRVDLKRGEPQLIVDRLVPIDGVPLEGGRLRLMLDEVKLNGAAGTALANVAELVRGKPAAAANGAGGAKNVQPAAGTALPVELVIGTQDQVAVLATDPKMRVQFEPELAQALEIELGAGMVRVVGGVALESTEKKRWEKKKPQFGGD